jgi:hypothetical protein
MARFALDAPGRDGRDGWSANRAITQCERES